MITSYCTDDDGKIREYLYHMFVSVDSELKAEDMNDDTKIFCAHCGVVGNIAEHKKLKKSTILHETS